MINHIIKPKEKPLSPFFGSGPCKKIPGWQTDYINNFYKSLSHRSDGGIEKISQVTSLTKKVLSIPDEYHIGIISGSATGAIESALWNLLGPRPVTILTHDFFSKRWEEDIVSQLKIENISIGNAPPGDLPKIKHISPDNDIVLNWNGSTTGVRFPKNSFQNHTNSGLLIADLTSAAFTVPIPWNDLDAAAFSWQKGLGGEAGQGMLVLSPRAIKRLKTYQPKWPVPYLLDLRNGNEFKKDTFENKTINTISMMTLEDFYIALKWADAKGGIESLSRLSQENLKSIQKWCDHHDWIDFMAKKENERSSSTITLVITNERYIKLPEKSQRNIIKNICKLLSDEEVAYEIENHPAAPPSFRIWGGPTVDNDDIKKLLPWIAWAYKKVIQTNKEIL